MFRRPDIFRKGNDLFIYDRTLIDKNPTAPEGNSKSGLLRIFLEFCAKSSIHGVAYIFERKRCLLERVWWAIAIALSLALGVYFATRSISYATQGSDSRYNRIILRQSKMLEPISQIPFPAVSICAVNKISIKKFNYTDVYRQLLKLDGEKSRNVTLEEFERMKAFCQSCEYSRYSNLTKLFTDDYANDSLVDLMDKLEPDFSDTFVYCKLFDKWIKCSEIFFRSVSDTGLCYSFNTVRLRDYLTDEMFFNVSEAPSHNHSSTWNIDSGKYEPNQVPFPMHVIDAGLQFSLTVILKTDSYDGDYLCGDPVPGFKIGFHSPFDFPSSRKNFYDLSPKQAVIYSIEPVFVSTSNDMQKFRPEERECFFSSERKLRFYRIYTTTNCIRECLATFTLAKCDCVHFAMPRSNDTKICGIRKRRCCSDAEQFFYSSEEVDKCNCKPSCTSLSYDAYSSFTDYDFERTLKPSIYQKDLEYSNATFSRLIVTFKDEVFVPWYRIENYNWFDSLSYAGGLCGFLLGISILSIIELLYYLTIRLWFAYRENQNLNNLWHIPHTFVP